MRRLLILVLFVIVCGRSANALNQDYDPHWITNDSWQVRVSYSERVYDYGITNMFPVVPVLTNQEVYRYHVVSVNPATQLTIIQVARLSPSSNSLVTEMSFDSSNVVLRAITLCVDGEISDQKSNPYEGNASWLFVGDTGHVITDFPVIPTSMTNEIQTVYKETIRSNSVSLRRKDLGDAFVQSYTVNTNSISLTMSCPTNGLPTRQVSFVWEKNKKWWTTATVTSGTSVKVTATLIE